MSDISGNKISDDILALQKHFSELSEDDIYSKRRSLDYGIAILGRKWVYHILGTLGHGPKSFNELSRDYNISPSALSEVLKFMERNTLVHRKVYDTKPIRVEYSLTENAYRFILEIGEPLAKWVIECIPGEYLEEHHQVYDSKIPTEHINGQNEKN